MAAEHRGAAPIVDALVESHLRAYIVMGEDDPASAQPWSSPALLQERKATVKLDARSGLGHEYPLEIETTLSRALKFLVSPD